MNFREIVKHINHLNEGISQTDLANAIYNRLERQHPDKISRHGAESVYNVVSDVAAFQAGAEEIGTSDISIMMREVLKKLDQGLDEELDVNPTDTVKMDVPLLLRIMEYSKEDAETDLDLHFVVQNLIELGKSGTTLTMNDYRKAITKSDDSDNNL
jgi:hypothetical protein